MSIKIDHVGIVVKNIDEAIKLFDNMLGLSPWELGVTSVPRDGLKQTQLQIGNNFIELIEPIATLDGSDSRFAKFLRERGEGLFHISLFTDEFDKYVTELKKKHFTVEETAVTDLFPGCNIRLAWIPPKETRGVWIEFVDETALPKSYGS